MNVAMWITLNIYLSQCDNRKITCFYSTWCWTRFQKSCRSHIKCSIRVSSFVGEGQTSSVVMRRWHQGGQQEQLKQEQHGGAPRSASAASYIHSSSSSDTNAAHWEEFLLPEQPNCCRTGFWEQTGLKERFTVTLVQELPQDQNET